MPKANDTDIYKYDLSISLMDYLFGSDADNGKKNKSYRIKDIIQLINGVNGKNNLQYLYSDGNNPEVTYYNPGVFFTDTNEADPLAFTQLIVNKSSLQPIDLTTLFQRLGELEDVVIKLDNPSDPNNFFNFKVVSIEDHIEYFTFKVELFKDFYLGEFLNETIYSVYFDIKSATESDDSKLDKASYTGNATDIDNRIQVLENLQDLNTNFTGQAFAVWTGVGYVYDIIYPNYYIQGVLYPGGTVQKTLDESDAVHPRFDVFAVNSEGAIVKTGTAEENPLTPSVDPETEIQITVIFVAASSTTPTDNTVTQVYNENIEWTPVSNYVDAVNFDATEVPYKGTKHADISAYGASQKIKFTNVSTLSILDYTTLKFALNLKGSFGKQRKFSIQFFNGATPVSTIYYIGNGQNNFKYNLINAYQLVVVDFTSLVFSSVSFDNIVIDFGYANPYGFRLDDVVLVKGSSVIVPTQKAITSIITDSGIANATIKDDTFQFKGANGLVVSAIGKIITFTSNFTAALKSNYDAAYAWVLAHGNVDNTSDANKPVSTAQQAALDLKLNTADYNQHYKGTFLTEAALNAAHPTANVGDSAQVNEAGGTDVVNYSWDAEENIWVAGGGTGGAANTDALPEGSSNLYFTTARVLATLLTGVSFATGGAIVSTDSVLAAFGKLQKQLTDGFTTSNIKLLLGITTLSGSNTGDETTASLKTKIDEVLPYACSDETSNLTTGVKITFRMPYAFTLSGVSASLNEAPTISSLIVDIKEGGISILSTLLSVDASEKTSVTAATPAVISDVNLAYDAEISISITQIGSGNSGKGLKVSLIGKKA